MASDAQPLIDEAELRDALALQTVPGNVYEVRVLEGRERPDGWGAQWAGWFTDLDAVVTELRRFRGGWYGAFLTPNPCDPLLLHKSANKLIKAKRGEQTTDLHIVRRLWLLSDFDPLVWGADGLIKGIPATDTERQAAHARRDLVHAALVADGLPAAVVGDSGNGGHLDWRVDLPVDSHLPERFIKAIAVLYGDDPGNAKRGWNRAATVEVDTGIFNAARIWKLYGTLSCKGAGVGDRPWRMARIVDVPPGGPELLTETELLAWIEAAEAKIAASAPVTETPAAPPARSSGDRSASPAIAGRSPAGDFDPRQLLEGAGLSVGDGRKRADGATFYELAVCPCERQAERKAVLSISASGACGLQCVNGSCAYSKGAGGPGEHWKSWRREHDPNYRPDAPPPGQAASERAEAVRGYAERMAEPAPANGVDVAGLLGGGELPAGEPERPAPRQATRRARQADDGRARIEVSQDSRAVRDQVIDALAGDPRLYVAQGKIARVQAAALVPLAAGALDSAAVDACAFVKTLRDKNSGEFVDRPDTLPVRVRGMLEALDDDGIAPFRQVDQVTRTPFWTPSGLAVLAAGYNAEARTVLVEPPELQMQPEPDGVACMDYLRELVSDFPFQGGLYGAEVSNLIGAMLAPMVRPMIAGPMPMLLIEGNVPGLGKSLLASMIRVLYGLEPEAGSLPKDEKLVASLMLGVLKKSEPVHVFDDVTHSVVSATLNRAITGRTYSDRILGISDTIAYVIRQLWIMTLNNARVSADIVRRVFRSRLRWDGPGRPEDRRDIRISDFVGHIERHRTAILSRLFQLVQEWVQADRPMPNDLPVMGSFEGFAGTIGGILRHAGDRAWLGNIGEAKEDLAIDDEWLPFVLTWATHPEHGTHWQKLQSPTQLWNMAGASGLLTSILGMGGNESAQVNRLAYHLKSHRDQVIGGYRVIAERDDKGHLLYRLGVVSAQANLILH